MSLLVNLNDEMHVVPDSNESLAEACRTNNLTSTQYVELLEYTLQPGQSVTATEAHYIDYYGVDV